MARTSKWLKFFVQVARPRFDTAIVEVEATDDGDAERKALAKAKRLPATEWTTQSFDAKVYCAHVTIIAADELPVAEQTDRARAAELLAESETRYVLLKSACEGEGDLLLQPWLVVDQPDLLTSDLCRDWLGALSELGLTHMSERLDDLAGGSPMLPSDRILFSPRRPKKGNA